MSRRQELRARQKHNNEASRGREHAFLMNIPRRTADRSAITNLDFASFSVCRGEESVAKAEQNIPIAKLCVYTSIRVFRGIPCFPAVSISALRALRRRVSCVSYCWHFVLAFLSHGHCLGCRPGQSAARGQRKRQEAPPEAGGPQNDVGPYAIPKKKEEPPPPPPPEKPKKVEGMPDYSINVDVPLVKCMCW